MGSDHKRMMPKFLLKTAKLSGLSISGIRWWGPLCSGPMEAMHKTWNHLSFNGFIILVIEEQQVNIQIYIESLMKFTSRGKSSGKKWEVLAWKKLSRKERRIDSLKRLFRKYSSVMLKKSYVNFLKII